MNKQFTMAAIVAVLMSFVCPITGWAQQEVTIDGVKYSLYDDNHAEVIQNQTSISGDLVIPASVNYNGVDYAVTSIGGWAFFGCSGLTSIEIPSSVTSIGHGAFDGCTGLTSVVIPEGVTSIDWGVFADCSSLTTIEVSSDNMNYISVDGVLYTKDKSELLAFPIGKDVTSFVIPEGVTSIGWGAFDACTGLTSVEIPSSVTSIGAFAFEGCSGLTSVEIPSSVTSIEKRAFAQSSLTSIAIPASVTSIGLGVLAGCSSLTTIEVSPDNMNYVSVEGVLYTKNKSELLAFPSGKNVTSFVIPGDVTSIGDYAFSGCSGLTSIKIPEGVTSIGDCAFEGCSGLTSVVIPLSVMTIGEVHAFLGCSSLETIYCKSVTPPSAYNSSFASISSYAVVYVPVGSKAAYEAAEGWQKFTIEESDFTDVLPISIDGIRYDLYSNGEATVTRCIWVKQGDVEIPFSVNYEGMDYTVTNIGESAFSSCYSLTSIVIPESVTSIGESAFSHCSGLTSFVIPEGVTNIGDYAFYYCSGLTSIVIPEGVTSIGDWTFWCCSGLTSIVIPEGVTSIGSSAFSWCDGLTSIVIPESVTSIGREAFLYCSSLTSINIPSGVTSIGREAFKGCSGLTSVVIPASVTSIGETAFLGCSGLTSIVISEGVTSIGKGAFRSCRSLTSVVIPEGVTSIGEYAFENSSSLETIYSKAVTPPSAYSSSFADISSDAVVYVPVGSKAAYEAADGWQELTIVEDQPSNTLYFGETVSAVPGSPTNIPVSLLNADAITAFRFDLVLPSGVALRKVQEGDSERYAVSLSDSRADTSHVVSVGMLSDTVARVVVYSTGNVPFNGNDSTVLNVGVDVSAAVALGEYALRMENIELVTPDEREYLVPSVDGLLVVNSMVIPGDVNGDGRVTISDVILAVNYLLGDTTSEIDLLAADLNGDGRVSLGDVVGIINLILNGDDNESNTTARSMSESAATTDDLFSVSLGYTENLLLFSLDNDTDYTAFQLDVTLPEGVSVSDAQVGPRASGHTIDWRVLSDGKVRVVVYSPANSLLEKGEGPLFALQLSTAGKLSETFPVSITDILLATPRGAEYKSRSLSEVLSIDDAVEEVRSAEPFTISVSEGVLQIHATESARLPLYTVGGTLLRVLDVEVGLNTYEGLPQGVYLLNKHKVLIP